jgi:hypothetical protein
MTGKKRPRSPAEQETIRLLSPENEAFLRSMGNRVSFSGWGSYVHRAMSGGIKIESAKDLQQLLQLHGFTRESAREVAFRGFPAVNPESDDAAWSALADLAAALKETK